MPDMHTALYILLGFTLLTNLACLVGIYYIKGVFRDTTKVGAVAKWVESTIIVFVLHLVFLLTFFVCAVAAGKMMVALFFLAFLASPFVIGLLAQDYRKVDKYIVVQLLSLLFSLAAIPLLLRGWIL
jgi:hypothetical protein